MDKASWSKKKLEEIVVKVRFWDSRVRVLLNHLRIAILEFLK